MVRINSLKKVSLILSLALVGMACTTTPKNTEETMESLTQYATNASLGNKSGWEATGYDYRDTSIEGFPCLHEFQVGGIVLMPTEGDLKTIPGPLNSIGQGYRLKIIM